MKTISPKASTRTFMIDNGWVTISSKAAPEGINWIVWIESIQIRDKSVPVPQQYTRRVYRVDGDPSALDLSHLITEELLSEYTLDELLAA